MDDRAVRWMNEVDELISELEVANANFYLCTLGLRSGEVCPNEEIISDGFCLCEKTFDDIQTKLKALLTDMVTVIR